jgi:hypothetical protein
MGNPKLKRWAGNDGGFPGANEEWKATIPPQQVQLAEEVLNQWFKRKRCYLFRLENKIPRSGCSVRDLDANVVVVLREMREPPG